jgi:hypothetical protein
MLLAEIKPSRFVRPGPDQIAWKYALLAVSQRWRLWGHEDLHDGTIERELDALATGVSIPSPVT